MVGGGLQAWAGRVGSGGRPRQRGRHAGAGRVAVAGRCGRTGRRPAVALRAPTPWGRRARWGHACRAGLAVGGRVCKGVGAPDAVPTAGRGTSGKLEAWPGGRGLGRAPGWRRAAEAEAAPCGCGARGGRGAAQADQPVAGGGPKSPTPWGRRARRGCRGVVRCRRAAVRGALPV